MDNFSHPDSRWMIDEMLHHLAISKMAVTLEVLTTIITDFFFQVGGTYLKKISGVKCLTNIYRGGGSSLKLGGCET